MADSRDAIEEIRSRIGVLELVSEYVTLKRAGKGHKGLCPFHSEKTPSFTVNEEFQTWHCFGCGEHGDIFGFVMKTENLTFPEALERLARRAGVELDRDAGRPSRKEQLTGVNALAEDYFAKLLAATPAALNYLRDRGLADETIRQFGIGYAGPSWEGLTAYLAKNGASLADAVEVGLVMKGDRGYRDRFRQRIIFPIQDVQERIVGYGGRALGDVQPKYLNSPETPLFVKTRLLYGLNFARKKIAEVGCAVVVEGYMDVITAHQAGFANCVATLGTALTLEHIKLLSRHTERVVLAYDADSAGMKAALRGASMFEDAPCEVRIARLPAGDDPDSLIRKGQGADFDAAISGALSVADYKLAVLMERYELSDPAGRAEMLKQASKVLAEVRTNAERERYIKVLARYHPNFETGTTRAEDHIRRDVEMLVSRQSTARPAESALRVRNALEQAEDGAIKALISGEGAALVMEELSPDNFSGDVRRRAAEFLFEIIREKKGIYLPEVLEAADAEVGRYISATAMREDLMPLTDAGLKDSVARIKNQRLRRSRTSDILAEYMKDGIIDPEKWSRGELDDYLKKSGKKPAARGD
ncbi:MAG: DNA primase [Armatimonadota bacterium]